MKKYMTCFIALFCFVLFNTILIFNINNNERNSVLRLHIVSNSNSTDDLIEKLKVNENVNSYLSTLNIDLLNSKKEVKETIYKNLGNIENVVNNTLKNDNVQYTSSIKYGKISYGKKDDINLSMEDGIYDSVQIILGDGNGENIWSLIFPDENSIEKIYPYENIIPGISNIYTKKSDKMNENNISYKSFIVEKIKVFTKNV